MASLCFPSTHITTNLGVRHSWNFCSGKPTCFRVHNSKGSSILDPQIKQEELSNGNVTITANDGFPIERARQLAHPPLVAALKAAAEENAASFHFPGHNRGRAAPSSLTQLIGRRAFCHDLPELPELDNLFAPEGPILEAQKLAAELFGASDTRFLVGGTTCGIQAAIMATCSRGEALILPRNSHVSAISAMVLSGAVPKYVFPDYDFDWDIATAVSASEIERALRELAVEGQKPGAVFITSPTYHGICSNVKEISSLCHSFGIPLIVDEAHGAHFGFHPLLPCSALKRGADVAVQSTHKVLCSLTQSSMLHISGDFVDREQIYRCLQLLQSTSPSYLLLASLDAATAQLRENPLKFFEKTIDLAMEARSAIRKIPGISVLDASQSLEHPAIDPLRVTVGVNDLGLSGYEADELLYEDQKIVSELCGSCSITFPFTPGTCREHVQRLVWGLKHLSSSFFQHKREKQRMKVTDLTFSYINMQLTPREAFFAKKRKVDIKDSVGKICGELICPYPPGIPIMIPGEVITKEALNNLLQVKASGAIVTGASDPLLSLIVICEV